MPDHFCVRGTRTPTRLSGKSTHIERLTKVRRAPHPGSACAPRHLADSPKPVSTLNYRLDFVQFLNGWLLTQSCLWIPLLVVVWGVGSVGWPLVVAASLLGASFGALCVGAGAGATIADRVTLARVLGTLAVAVLIGVEARVTWLSWALLLVTALVDLVDGWCARRFGGSEAGAVLDMEADQGFVLLASVAAVSTGTVGPWILLLPGFKYLYVLFAFASGFPPHDPKPRPEGNGRGKVVCFFVVASLVTILAPPLPRAVDTALGIAAVAALALSFGSDARYLVGEAQRQRAESV